MSKNLLWSPSDKDTHLHKFVNLHNLEIKNKDYNSIHNWSINNKEDFWSSVWDYTNIIGEKTNPIIENEDRFIESKFFKNCKLNYAENLMQKNDGEDALVFYSEKELTRRVTWKKLRVDVNKVSSYFKKIGVKSGDRIAGILPNFPETVISFLSAAKIGAIWSSCSTDFGPNAIIDRFKQINPKILIISDFYFYKKKKIDTLKNIKEILKDIPSIEKVIIIPYDNVEKKYDVNFPYITWHNILKDNEELKFFEKFEFNKPLYILYSSGTTGIPKCIVHGAGGSLIQHKKEHQLHCNIRENDRVFYFTTCGWMMWNWLVSCLATKATIYLYDGSPFIPKNEYLFEIIEKEKITFFGTGAKYLDTLKNNNIKIINKYKLDFLRSIASTGSPLMHETFEYVYEKIKKNIHLSSISGGTDIVSCFVLGNPNEPVYAGEIQCKGLGMDVDVFDESGNSILKEKGELVCKSPFPSKPIFFYNDEQNKKYYNAYFSKYKNIWHHGDYAEITQNKGFIIYGRSDATLNSGGVRIGTSELYRVVENIENIDECLAAELLIKGDTKVILFVKILNEKILDSNFKNLIKNQIRKMLSPKHLPSEIIKVIDIPKTKNGKIVEIIVKKILNNDKIDNINSLINPECLKEYYDIVKKLSR